MRNTTEQVISPFEDLTVVFGKDGGNEGDDKIP